MHRWFAILFLLLVPLQFASAGMDGYRDRTQVEQDTPVLEALQVSKTPTFFVNGRNLPSFGPEHLARLVAEEVGKGLP